MRQFSFLIIVLCFMLVACSPSDSDGSQTIDNQIDIELPQTFNSRLDTGATLAVNYPDEWFAGDAIAGTIDIVNEESLLSGACCHQVVESGHIVVNISFSDGEEWTFLDEDLSTADIATLTVGFAIDSSGRDITTNLEETTINNNEATIITLEWANQGLTMIVTKIEDDFMSLYAMTTSDVLDENQALFRAIIASASYAPAE